MRDGGPRDGGEDTGPRTRLHCFPIGEAVPFGPIAPNLDFGPNLEFGRSGYASGERRGGIG
jgi:hypothetical protein